MSQKHPFRGGGDGAASLYWRAAKGFGFVGAVGLATVFASGPIQADPQIPAGMVPYKHPVFKDGHRVLWHGPSHGGGGGAHAAVAAGTIEILVDSSDPTEHGTGDAIVAALKAANVKAAMVAGSVTPDRLKGGKGQPELALVSLPPLMVNEDAKTLTDQAPIVARFGAETIEIIAPKATTDVSALEGAQIDTGPWGSPQAVTMNALFEKLGVHPKVQHHPQDQALQLLQEGKVDAVASMGAPSPSLIGDFGAKGEFHILTVPWSPALRGLFTPAAVSDHDRPHLIPAGGSVATVGAPIALIALGGDAMSEDAVSAAKALYESFAAEDGPWRGPAWKDVNFACVTAHWPRTKVFDDWLAVRGGPDPSLATLQTGLDAAAADPDKVYASLVRWRSSSP